MVSLTKDRKILYRAAHPNCLPFPLSGDISLLAGIPRIPLNELAPGLKLPGMASTLAELAEKLPSDYGKVCGDSAGAGKRHRIKGSALAKVTR
jgi:hypothetical protein